MTTYSVKSCRSKAIGTFTEILNKPIETCMLSNMKNRRIDNRAENVQSSKLCLISIEISKEYGVMPYFFLSSIFPANGEPKTWPSLIVNAIRSIYFASIIRNGPASEFTINKRSKCRNDIAQNQFCWSSANQKYPWIESNWRTQHIAKNVHVKQIPFIHLLDKRSSEVALANMVEFIWISPFFLFASFVGELACIANYGI